MNINDVILTLKASAEKEIQTHNVVVAIIGHDSEIIMLQYGEHLTRNMYRFYKAGAGIFDENEIVLCHLYINGERADTLVRLARNSEIVLY